jgi:hypothetical protein
MSGILKLANALSLPIITNNQAYLNTNGSTMISQTNSYPLPEEIHKAVVAFMDIPKTPAKFDPEYNQGMVVSVQKLVGV